MTSRDRRRKQVADAIFADEIGLEYAIHEDFRLRSTYQPIFEPRGRLLRMVAVEAAVEAHRRGCAVSAAEFLDTVAPCERLYVDALCRMLHLRNYRHVGVEGVKLFFNFDFAANDLDGRMVAELRQMAGRLDELGLHPARLMCEVVVSCSDDSETLDVLVQEMRAGGLGVALASFGTGNDTERLLNLIRPDLVRVDGALFALLCSYPAAGRLFGRLVSVVQDSGVRVLVEGIATPRQLEVALEAGCDLLQGSLLARPLSAGAFFDDGPLAIQHFLPSAREASEQAF
jgi:EAL domain-containing protein (putative c-di-GMP-specific phosphodiesterase class I)